ncbi:hypothetical protein ACFE04_007539 [Oxalis oulophora]
MISGSNSCNSNGLNNEQVVRAISMEENYSSSDHHSNALLYDLSLLKQKVSQVQSLVNIIISSNQQESTPLAITNMSSLIQEISVTTSSMMFHCQQLSGNPCSHELRQQHHVKATASVLLHSSFSGEQTSSLGNIYEGQEFYSSENINWHSTHNSNNDTIKVDTNSEFPPGVSDNIIELDVANLLANYAHYCEICGKGFKRDANLRMHMRAHGDKYKTIAALCNPMKKNNSTNSECSAKLASKLYSCPQEGCRWNQKHVNFQPLKSMICVKNHFKRSHCPKTYVCKRCSRKEYSVLSDLRTHEKHCGDPFKWQCSCGTVFSRKDKLMNHVALFVGHIPVITTPQSENMRSRGNERDVDIKLKSTIESNN